VWRNVVLTLAAATFISTAIEVFQILLPARSPSYLDILCNMAGAAVGLILTLMYADKTPTHAEKI
jgi:VanZ family protein